MLGLNFYLAEVLGTTDLHMIGVGSSILPFATNLYASIRKLAKRPASKAVVCEFDSHSKYH